MKNKIARELQLNKSYLDSLSRIAAFEQQLAAKDAEIARLRKALEPFAKRADYFDRTLMTNGNKWPDGHYYADDDPSEIYIGHLRAARAVLVETPAAPEVK